MITAAKRLFNSDKICRSYCDFYLDVTFLEHSVETEITEIRARSRRLARLCGQNHHHTQFPKCCCRRPQDVQRCAVCSHQQVSLDTRAHAHTYKLYQVARK